MPAATSSWRPWGAVPFMPPPVGVGEEAPGLVPDGCSGAWLAAGREVGAGWRRGLLVPSGTSPPWALAAPANPERTVAAALFGAERLAACLAGAGSAAASERRDQVLVEHAGTDEVPRLKAALLRVSNRRRAIRTEPRQNQQKKNVLLCRLTVDAQPRAPISDCRPREQQRGIRLFRRKRLGLIDGRRRFKGGRPDWVLRDEYGFW